MFSNQPKGLYVLALANTGERFGYYTMLAVFLLFLQAKFGFDAAVSGQIYATFLAVVYFMPLFGGWVADKWNFSKCVVAGIFVMLAGYVVMAVPTPVRSDSSFLILCGGLIMIALGTGLFKGNLQVMVGDLYNKAGYESQRDAGFSIFYMAINIGSMFAPMTATAMCNVAMHQADLTYVATLPDLCNGLLDGNTANAALITDIASKAGMSIGGDINAWAANYIEVLSKGYNFGFAIACLSLVFSYIVYALGKPTFRDVLTAAKGNAKKAEEAGVELTKEQTKARIIALFLVFAVVLFFWMVFHQNGTTLTEFAKNCTSSEATGFMRIGFNIWALGAAVIGVYALFSFFQSKKVQWKVISGVVLLGMIVALFVINGTQPDPVTGIQPQQFQQFNPFFVVALTPVSLALFGWLASRKKEPSAPRKIGMGMVMAAGAFCIMIVASLGLSGFQGSVSPNWLIATYLILTFAELLLSPMGISFVSKVAPPKYKGAMMGCWFGATAIGNYLVSIPMMLWGKIPLWSLWGLLVVICLLCAAFIFGIMKKLEAATGDAPAPMKETAEGEAVAADVEI